MLDVLIVGAGPTGLFLATELLRYGLSCRIIDKAPTPSEHSKALAIQPRTLEIFHHVDLIDPFLEQGLAVKTGHLLIENKEIALLKFSQVDSPFPFILSLEQSKTEAILAAFAASKGVQVERELTYLYGVEDAEGVNSCCRHGATGQEEQIRSRFVVGCDGGSSTVRKSLHIPFLGTAFPSLFSLADVQLHWDRPPAEAFLFLDKEGVMGAIPMPGPQRYRLVFQRKPLEPELTFEQIQARFRKRATLSDPRWLSHFHIHTRLARNYQQGRFFLAGDAAHVHSPIGGQGMNSGLQDAFNLAWRLASNNPTLIHTYETERHAWGATLLKGTLRATRLATLSNFWLRHLRNGILRFLLPLLHTRLLAAVAQLTLRYPNGSTRAPNVPVGNSDLYTRMRGTTAPHLLLFGVESPPHPEGIPLTMDHPLAWKRYKIKDKGLCLIRPDLYIAWINTKF